VKAVQHAVHGGPEVLELVDLADPVPRPGEVVVEVRAAGVNRLDLLQREGPPLLPGFRLPHIPGMDIAGEVVEVGDGVDPALVGRRVVVKAGVACGACAACRAGDDRACANPTTIGGNRPGGYAERCAVPGSHVFPIPEGVGDVEAAAVPTACVTAWRSLVGTARLRPGEQVVIHGAGSAVSVLAIQIAKHLGARVIVTSRSPAKLARALELGADVGIDETRPDAAEAVLEATGGGADVVFNHVGPAVFELSLRSLRREGRLVVCGTTTGAEVRLRLPTVYHLGIEILGAKVQSHADFGPMLEECWRSGFRSVIDSVFELAAAADAHVRLESGEVFGKVVLVP